MNKRQLADEVKALNDLAVTLSETMESMETRHAIDLHEATSFQRALAQEQKDGFWTSLDASATKRNRSFADVERNLKDAYSAWCVHPFAKSYVDYQRFFVVGKGTLITAEEDVDGIDSKPQDTVDLFLKVNNWSSLEKTITEELSRDGEVFVRYHDMNRNDLQATVGTLSIVDPLEITDIDAPDVNDPQRFRRVYSETTWSEDGTKQTVNLNEWIPGDEIHHIKINCSHNEHRGRSDLLPALPWMKQHKAFMNDMSRRNYMANAFVWDVTTSGGIKPTSVTGQYPQGPAPGSVIAHTDNEQWKVNAPDMKWADSTKGARELKLMICALFKLPESWFGDTGESNLATTKALAMPSLKAFQDRQDFLKEHFEQIISHGSRVNVDVSFQEVVSEDAKVKGEALVAVSTALDNLTTSGLVSRETAYKILQGYVEELDPWTDEGGEKIKIEAEEQGDVLAIAQGSKPGNVPRPSLEGEIPGVLPAPMIPTPV